MGRRLNTTICFIAPEKSGKTILASIITTGRMYADCRQVDVEEIQEKDVKHLVKSHTLIINFKNLAEYKMALQKFQKLFAHRNVKIWAIKPMGMFKN